MTDRRDWKAPLLEQTFVRSVEQRDELPSTNDLALSLIRDALPELPALIVADRQTHGRGRGSHRWFSAGGSLTFSLVVQTEVLGFSSPPTPRIALVMGLAVADAVQAALPSAAVGLCWPNDVLIGGRKVCGILVEMSPQRPELAVLGVGVNVNNPFDSAPQEVRQRATSLKRESGRTISLLDLLVQILQTFASHAERLKDNPEWLAAQWPRYCALFGRTVSFRLRSEIHWGLCRGIQSDGALLIQTSHGLQPVYSATAVRAVDALPGPDTAARSW